MAASMRQISMIGSIENFLGILGNSKRRLKSKQTSSETLRHARQT